MVAHDLRGPVSVIQKVLDLLLEQWDELDADQQRDGSSGPAPAPTPSAALTDDVFDLSLIDAGSLEVAIECLRSRGRRP